MNDLEIDQLLERFDQTEPSLQRRIIAKLVSDRTWLLAALEISIVLQNHYAKILNSHDGGQRRMFGDTQEWIDRLAEMGKIPRDHGLKCSPWTEKTS